MRCGEEFYKLSFIFWVFYYWGFFPDVCVGPPKEGESLPKGEPYGAPGLWRSKRNAGDEVSEARGKVPVNQNIPTGQRNTQYVRLTCVTTKVLTRPELCCSSFKDVQSWSLMHSSPI